MPKGLKKQIFGTALLALGLVGVVLSGAWNSEPDLFDVVLMTGGVGLWLYGTIEKRWHRQRSSESATLPPSGARSETPTE
jgi:drug/metabolite transporter (DMT)-like permease